MTKNLSNNSPLRSSDKKSIRNLPLDDRHITPTFDAISSKLGKYISQDSQCIIFHQVSQQENFLLTSRKGLPVAIRLSQLISVKS